MRPWYLLAALLLIPSVASRTCHAERPNILFIYADDQSYKTLSCYPEAPDWVHTPNIDALAREGIRFERCYFGAWCMPSRASFLTGYLQHGVPTMRNAAALTGHSGTLLGAFDASCPVRTA